MVLRCAHDSSVCQCNHSTCARLLRIQTYIYVQQVFVGGVPRGATEEQIKEYASKVGPVRLRIV